MQCILTHPGDQSFLDFVFRCWETIQEL